MNFNKLFSHLSKKESKKEPKKESNSPSPPMTQVSIPQVSTPVPFDIDDLFKTSAPKEYRFEYVYEANYHPALLSRIADARMAVPAVAKRAS